MNKYLIFLIFLFSFSILAQNDIQKLLGKDYQTFVRELGENIKDEKFLAALKAGDGLKDKIAFELNVDYEVGELIPTQNEIDVEKSLKFPLQNIDQELLLSYLRPKDGEIFAPGGPIITAGGKYIIDGHHRWSQLFLINPHARIRAINMKIADPIAALKFTQMAIGSVAKRIPVSIVTGKNLISMQEADFNKWVSDNIGANALLAFKEVGINSLEAVIAHIWQNAQLMQQKNAPIKGAPSRGLMPQTDQAAGWLEALSRGQINIYNQ